MFYIYKFHRATSGYLVWFQFTPVHRFTSTAHCEIYLKNLGYSLAEICRFFAFRFFSNHHQVMLIEYKSAVPYGR